MGHSLDSIISSDALGGKTSMARFSRPADRPARTFAIWAVCGFLLLAVGLVFGQTVHYKFTGYDDGGFVYENPHVTAGLTRSGLWWALTDGPYGDWYPLTSVSHMLDCQLYGLEPAGHHLTNVLLHAASSVLLFLVLLRMTGALWPSAWVAAVFAVHPLHVESVAWIAERRDVLSGLFFMLTLGAYALYTERPSLARYLAVAGCFALGLMAKPMLVTVPFLLLLLDYWPLDRFRPSSGRPLKNGTGSEHHRANLKKKGRREVPVPIFQHTARSGSWFGRWPIAWRLVIEKIPLMALAAVSCAIVLLLHTPMQSNRQVDRLSLATRLANALVSYAAYLVQSFYPVDLSPFYPHLGTRLPTLSIVGSLILLLAITAVALYCWRRLPYLPVGWLWFLGMLVPVIGLVGSFVHGRADRYTYLSQIGLSIALAWSVWSFYRSRQSRRQEQWRQTTLAVVSGAAVLALAAVAWRQTSYWRDNETVWTRAVACTDQNAMAHYCLGGVYASQGRTEDAIAQIRTALAIDSIAPYVTADSHILLAECLASQGKIGEALTHYEQAVRVSPANELAHARWAVALARAGQLDRAIAEFREAVRLNPAFSGARVDFANTLLARGEASEAAAQCREVLEVDPQAVQAMIILGAALAAEGDAEEALSQFERAVTLEPSNAQAHFRLGLAQNDRGQTGRALAQLTEAIRLRPDDVPILWQTAWLLATSPDSSVRDGARAVQLATRAVQLSGGREARAFDALAAALAETEEFSAAVEAAEQASAIALIRNDDALASAIQQRTRLYRLGQPYREPAQPQSAQPLPTEQTPPAPPE